MKNRILKKSGVIGMVCLLGVMTAGSVSACGTVSYAAESAAENEEALERFEDSDASDGMDEIISEMISNNVEVSEDAYEETEEFFESADTEFTENMKDAGNWEDTDEEFSEEIANEIDHVEDSGVSDSVNMQSNEQPVSKKADILLDVQADSPSVKAGSDLVYTVMLENTGETVLRNVRVSYDFGQDVLTGEWSDENAGSISSGTDAAENIAYIETMDIGMRKKLYLTLRLPEEQETSLSLKVHAEAQAENQDMLNKEAMTETEIIPLKASFEVTKTADRSVALPGEQIMFQICIRNTGERTLHSVITTERFKTGNIPVQFIEKEGVVLNNTKTKARIEKIEPGMAAGLEAVVTLPENLTSQELLNEVTVTTQETGEQVMTSQAKIQVEAVKEKEEEEDKDSTEILESGAAVHTGESRPASTHPKTGDPYQPFLWLAMIPGSVIAAGCNYN